MTHKFLPILLAGAVLAAGCGKKAEEGKAQGKPPAGALISVTQPQRQTIEETQESLGQVDSDAAPLIAAEIAGRVAKIHADAGDAVKEGQALAELDAQDQKIENQAAQAEAERLKALLVNQQLVHERNRQLRARGFLSQAALDNSEAQLTAAREQLHGARMRLEASRRALEKTAIVSPAAGRIDQRKVSAGDYVKAGDPLFRLVSGSALTVRLPFPEGVAARLKTGQKVRLFTPPAPDGKVTATISEIKPLVGAGSRAIEALVRLRNPGGWAPGASVTGVVVLAEREALTVPEQSAVLRPAGEVVYVVKEGRAGQRLVKTGVRQRGYVEILSGVAAGETIALDGAGFLADQAPVTLQQTKTETGKAN